FEMSHIPFVQTQKLAARRQIIVHDVEYLAIDSILQSDECDRLCTVVNVRERDRVRAAKVQKDTKRPDPHPARDADFSGAIDGPRPDDDIWDTESVTILHDDFVLFDFREGIGVVPEFGMSFNWARLIQHPPPRFLRVGINRERTYIDKPLQ